jgi:hypothetical protein
MTQTVKISFTLDTTDATAQLGFESWIDNHKFYDTDHVTAPEHVSVDISDDDAEHELRFVLKNKTIEHTQIDEGGNIIADTRLKIMDLAFDEIALGHMVTEQAVYEHDFNGSGPKTQDQFYGEIGCNGTVSLKFATPVYLWVLEHM